MNVQREIDVRRPVDDGAFAAEQDGHSNHGLQIVRETVPARVSSGQRAQVEGVDEPVPSSAVWPKVTYVGGAVWSLLVWATAEGFGRMSSGVATDIGTAIVYSGVFLALLAADQCERTRPFSIDAAIERRLPWWRRVAEIRR